MTKIIVKDFVMCVRFDKYDEKLFYQNQNGEKSCQKIYPTSEHQLLPESYEVSNLTITEVVEFELWDDEGYIFSYILNKDDWKNNIECINQ